MIKRLRYLDWNALWDAKLLLLTLVEMNWWWSLDELVVES
jgi:hypothetical protein